MTDDEPDDVWAQVEAGLMAWAFLATDGPPGPDLRLVWPVMEREHQLDQASEYVDHPKSRTGADVIPMWSPHGRMPTFWAVVSGGITSGFQAYGPFANQEDALEWGNDSEESGFLTHSWSALEIHFERR
jgi:hypothetical protein